MEGGWWLHPTDVHFGVVKAAFPPASSLLTSGAPAPSVLSWALTRVVIKGGKKASPLHVKYFVNDIYILQCSSCKTI